MTMLGIKLQHKGNSLMHILLINFKIVHALHVKSVVDLPRTTRGRKIN